MVKKILYNRINSRSIAQNGATPARSPSIQSMGPREDTQDASLSDRLVRMPDSAKMFGMAESTLWDHCNPRSPRFDKNLPPIIRGHSDDAISGVSGMLLSDITEFLQTRRAHALQKRAEKLTAQKSPLTFNPNEN